MAKKRFKLLLKWSSIVIVSYFVLTTLYFGYDDIDSNKGVYKFYWSGLRGIWEKDRVFGIKTNEIVPTKLDGVDGPYVHGDTLFYVTQDNQFLTQQIDSTKLIRVETSCKELETFLVRLKDTIAIEKDEYEMPDRLIAISDIEGNFTGLYSFLLANHVIDKNGNWIFGKGHLVLNGDFFDRGDQVAQVLWLIYALEQQAERAGGKVHFILGNHEIMNMYGDVSYNDFKYIEVAKRVSKQSDWDKALRYLYSEHSELGKWLRSKNIIERIGDYLFVHAGLNTLHSNGNYSIAELNNISRTYNGIIPVEENIKNKRDRPVLSSVNSPYWDRGLNFDWKYKIVFKLNGVDKKETSQSELDSVLQFYNASGIVIGHSVVSDISTGYNNKVIKIDVKHGSGMNSGKTKGILIEAGTLYWIDDKSNKGKLKS